MRKIFSLAILLLFGAAVLGPSQGQAFNSATHIYIAERVFPCTFDKINLYYGSIAPDIALYVDAGNWSYAFCETHYKFTKLPYAWWNLTEKAFAKGWQTHNEIWGADAYAHGTCDNYDNCVSFENCALDNCSQYCNYNGYVPTQADALADVIAWYFGNDVLKETPELAHFAIEVAIDLLLARYHDPSLGLKLFLAAKYRSRKDFDLMLKTFATDKDTLEAAEGTFYYLVTYYATALALPDPLRMVALGELGSEIAKNYNVDIDPVEVRWILRIAIYLCQNSNYFGVIQSAIDGIRTNPELIK